MTRPAADAEYASSQPSVWGSAAVGLVSPKTEGNVGGAMRAAYCYGATLILLEGERTQRCVGSPLDTIKSWKTVPTLHGSIRDLIPHGHVPVAVDLVPDAEPLPIFQHPKQALYIFGPEDGTLGERHLDWCVRRVYVPTRNCMNLAATVNVVLYDRLAKWDRHRRGVRVASLVGDECG